MATDETLQLTIGDAVVQCATADDKVQLEPVGGILADGSTEGYGLDELDAMVATLAKYNQPQALARLKSLLEKRRKQDGG
jgi:hypothetical protein